MLLENNSIQLDFSKKEHNLRNVGHL